MSEYRRGEVVDVEIKGALVVSDGYDDRYGSAYVRVELSVNGEHATGKVHLAAEGVTITRVAPAEWPPRPGDVWRTRRQQYYVVGSPSGAMAMVGTCGQRYTIEWVLSVGSLELVHREDDEAVDQ